MGALNEVRGFTEVQSHPLTRLFRAAWHVAAAWGWRVTPEVVLACRADFKNLSFMHRSVLTGLSWLDKWTVCKIMQMCILMLSFVSSLCLCLFRSIIVKNWANALWILNSIIICVNVYQSERVCICAVYVCGFSFLLWFLYQCDEVQVVCYL